MSSQDKVVLSYHDSLLRESDIALLRGPHWLNDMIICFWFEFLERDLLADHAKEIAFVSPQVSQFIKLCGADEARLMLDPLELSSKKLVLLPINDCEFEDSPGGTHWSLLAFRRSQGFSHYDSCKESNMFQARSMASVLASHLGWDASARPVKEEACPSQENGYDCGIHVICNAENVCEKLVGAGKIGTHLKLNADPKSKRKHILETISSLSEKR